MRAAASARAWAVASLTERNARNAFCKSGGTIVNASSVGDPEAPRQGRTRACRHAPRLPDAEPDCRARAASVGEAAASPLASTQARRTKGGPTVTKVIPPGVYRAAFTEQEFLAAGASPVDAKGNAGTWTLTTTADGYQSYEVVKSISGSLGEVRPTEDVSPQRARRAGGTWGGMRRRPNRLRGVEAHCRGLAVYESRSRASSQSRFLPQPRLEEDRLTRSGGRRYGKQSLEPPPRPLDRAVERADTVFDRDRRSRSTGRR